jgi:hypothetical protein
MSILPKTLCVANVTMHNLFGVVVDLLLFLVQIVSAIWGIRQ